MDAEKAISTLATPDNQPPMRTNRHAFYRLIALTEIHATSLARATRVLRAVAGLPADLPVVAESAPGWGWYGDPENWLENPLVPDEDESLLGDLMDAQNKAADFVAACDTKFDQDLQHAQGAPDPSIQAHEVAAAVERYQRCLLRPHPQHMFGPNS